MQQLLFLSLILTAYCLPEERFLWTGYTKNSHCMRYRPDWRGCLYCEEGYYNSPYGCLSCRTFDENCVTCKGLHLCEVCAGGYFNHNRSCLPCGEGCLECEDEDKCLTCASETPRNGICEDTGETDQCTSKIPNCETCRGSVCDSCANGYVLDTENQCIDDPRDN